MIAPEAAAGLGWSRAAAWALALTATFTMAVSYVDRQTLAVLAPTITDTLHISEAQYGWLISAFSIAYLIGSPLAGSLIDRVGARRGLLGAVLVWSTIAALHALVPGFAALFALRIALGLAEAPSFPGSAQAVHRVLPRHERARGLGVLFTGSSFGAMIAPPVATYLQARWGWRVAILCTAGVGLSWVPVWIAVAFRPAARRVLDGVAEPTSNAPRASLGEVLRHPAVVRGVLVIFASAPIIAFVLNWGAKYLVRDHHLAQADVGQYLWFPPVLYDAGSIAFGHFASIRSRRTSSPPQALLAGAALLALVGAAIPFAGGVWPSIVLAGVALAGGGGLYALLTADMLARVPPTAVSTAGGMCAAAQSLSYIMIGPLIGYFVGRFARYTEILVALALWVLPGSIAWLLWTPPPVYEPTSTT